MTWRCSPDKAFSLLLSPYRFDAPTFLCASWNFTLIHSCSTKQHRIYMTSRYQYMGTAALRSIVACCVLHNTTKLGLAQIYLKESAWCAEHIFQC